MAHRLNYKLSTLMMNMTDQPEKKEEISYEQYLRILYEKEEVLLNSEHITESRKRRKEENSNNGKSDNSCSGKQFGRGGKRFKFDKKEAKDEKLAPNQCAKCKGFGHHAKDCTL